LPGPNDDVVISPANTSVTITHSSGAHTIKSLMSQAPFQLTGGSLTVVSTVQVNSIFMLSGGTLTSSTVVRGTNGAALVVSGSGTLNGVTVNGVLDVGNTYSGALLTVTNGLVLNGTALLGSPTNSNNGGLRFAGTQSLSGNGVVVFGTVSASGFSYPGNALFLADAGTTLTIAPGITVRGRNGAIGFGGWWPSQSGVMVINQGTISCDVSGGTLWICGQPFNNQGLAQAINGGALSFQYPWSNSGTLAASNGTLNLMNNFTTAELGTIQATNGTVNLNGTLDNTGSTLVLGAEGGSWVLAGGTIRGGTLVATNGAELLVQGGMLDGVTLDGVLDVGNTYSGALLTVTNGLVLNGTALLGSPTNSNNGGLSFAGTQSLSGNGVVVFGTVSASGFSYPGNALFLADAGTTLTIAPGITVRGRNGAIGFGGWWKSQSGVTVINQGTISCDVSGGTISICGQPFDNQGLAQAINGGALGFQYTWTNAGTLLANKGTVNFMSSFTTAALGTILATNGTLELNGTLDNTGSTLVLGAEDGTWLFQSGTIRGGTMVATNRAGLVVQGGTLDGVTVNGVLDVGNSMGATLTVTNGLVLNGTALVGNPTNGISGNIAFSGTQSLSGNATVIFGNYGNALYLANGGTTLTIGAGITVRGQNGIIGNIGRYVPQNVSVINQGTISCDVNKGTITLVAQPFVNAGLAQATSGGALSIPGAWSNGGILAEINGTLNLNGIVTTSTLGVIQQAGGTVNLNGTLYNTNSALVLNAVGGPLVLSGTIQGGTVVATNGLALVANGGMLDGVTVNGVLDVGNSMGATLTVTNGLVLNGTALVGNPTNGISGNIAFSGTQSLSGNATVIFGNYGNALYLANGGTTLTIGAGITVRGQNGIIGNTGRYVPQNVSVINQGTISCDVNKGTITLVAQPFINAGLAQAINGGALSIPGAWSNGGILAETNGTLNLNGGFTTPTLGTIQQAGGTVNLNGTLYNTNSALVLNAVGGPWILNGTIQGGTVVATNGLALVANGGMLDGVTVNGVLDVGNSMGTTLTVTNGLVLNGTALVGNPTNGISGNVAFSGTQSLSGNATVIFGNYGNALYLAKDGTTLTIGAGIKLRGQNGIIGNTGRYVPQNVSIINQGTISCDVNAGMVQIYGAVFTNSATLSAEHGTLMIGAAGVFLQPSGTLSVGLSSATDFGTIVYNSGANLNLSQAGTFQVILNGGYVPSLGVSFQLLTASGSGTFSGAFPGFSSPSGAIWQTKYTSTALILTDVGQITWAAPGAITYGTALGENQLSAATTPALAGSFAYTPPTGTVLGAGVQVLTAAFISSNPGYEPASLQAPITVLPAPLSITASNQSKTYGQNSSFAGTEFMVSGLINGDTVTYVTLSSVGAAGNASVAGSPYGIVPSAAAGSGVGNYAITYTPGALTVNPAALTVTASAETKSYGQTLTFGSGSALFTSSGLQNGETIGSVTLVVSNNGGAAIAPLSGSPYIIAPSAATGGTFTPGNYALTYGNGALTVNPATLTITANNLTKTLGQALAFAGTEFWTSGLVNHDTVNSVTLVSAGEATTATAAGSPYAIVPSAAVGDGLGNYTITYVNGALTVLLWAPVMTWTNPASMTYGAALSSNQLNAAANIPGIFAYTPTNGTVLYTGTNTLSVIFTPADAADYSSATSTVSLVVSPAPLTVTASNFTRPFGVANPVFAGAITGLTNGDSITATYSCGATTSSAQGTYPIVPSLVDPNDLQTNYTVSLVNGALTVGQGAPILTWANPAPMIYGAALTANQLNATANMPGRLAYIPASGTMLNAGTNLLSVIFTPIDATDYASATSTVSLVVLPAPLTVTASNVGRPFGAANPTFTGILTGLTNGDNITATYGCGATISSPPGTYPIAPNLVDPNDLETNYTVNLINGTLTVNQGRPILAWTNPAPITYGAALGSNQLNAAANIPGSFAYTPTNGSVLYTGANALSAIFTPADTADYSSATTTVSLVVSPASLMVTASSLSRPFGASNPVFTGAITGVTNGDSITATYSCVAATNSPPGNYPIAPSLVDPGDLETNYEVTLVDGSLTVLPAAPPAIASVVPSIGSTNGGTVLSITGAGFENGATVSFGSLPAAAIQWISSTNLSATTPPGPAGAVNIVVANADGQVTVLTNGFTYLPPGPVDHPVVLTGYNRDVVVENNATGGNTSPYAQAFDSVNQLAFYEAGLGGIGVWKYGNGSEGLPASGAFTSSLDGATVFQFEPYSGSNVLHLDANSPSGTLKMKTPAAYTSLSILSASANGGGAGSLVIEFADNTTSPPLNFNASDWLGTGPGAALTHFGEMSLGDFGSFFSVDPANNTPNLYQSTTNLAAAGLSSKLIVSLTFTMPTGSGAPTDTGIFAVSGTLATNTAPPPPVFLAVSRTSGNIYFTWSAIAGRVYQLQYKTNLSQTAWSNVGKVVIATNSSATASDSVGQERQRFYRAVCLP